jgi:hypothetical protein
MLQQIHKSLKFLKEMATLAANEQDIVTNSFYII